MTRTTNHEPLTTNATVVIKIGGSTLGAHDTTLEDIAELRRRGVCPIVVHGGGAMISDWLKRLGVPTKFENGLRVTDAPALEVVVAVLAGVVNKQLTAQLQALGAPALGMAGSDGGLLRCRIADPALGLVGEIDAVDADVVGGIAAAGAVPVVAPIGMLFEDIHPTGQLLNVNADTAAGAIAASLCADWLIFMTDVPGVQADGAVLESLSAADAARLRADGTIEGGMIPKVEACLHAANAGARSVIIDGREPHALIALMDGGRTGTVVG